MRDTFVNKLMQLAEKDRHVMLITGDLGFGVLKPFWETYPDQFINAGIAEQAMTGLAAGLAIEGKTVFTYSIGNFPTLRCLEQIRNDCAYHDANVKIVCVGGGFTYGALGMSHHATEDVAIMRALPGVTLFTPSDPMETGRCVELIYETQGTCYLRLGRGGEKQIHEGKCTFNVGEAVLGRAGCRIVFLVAGAIAGEVFAAAERLDQKGIRPAIYTFPTVKPLDTATILRSALEFDHIVTIEEHNIVGGFGSAVAEILSATSKPRAVLTRIGLEDTYSSIVGSQEYLRDRYGMSADKIVAKVLGLING